MDTNLTALQRAVELAGGQSALARHIHCESHPVRQGHVWNWLNIKGQQVPPAIAPAIEAQTGVTCEQLRPDLRWQRDGDGRVIAYAVPLSPIKTGKTAALKPA